MTSLFPADSSDILPFDGRAQLFPQFFDTSTAQEHFNGLISEVPWEEHHLILFGKKVPEPRRSAWIADNDIHYVYSGVERVAHSWTPSLTSIREAITHETGHPFNSVLANLQWPRACYRFSLLRGRASVRLSSSHQQRKSCSRPAPRLFASHERAVTTLLAAQHRTEQEGHVSAHQSHISFCHLVNMTRCFMAVVEISHPEEGITLITLNRPEKLNAMTTELVSALHHALDEVSVDPHTRVVVLTGAGKGFCAGLDLTGYGVAPGMPHTGKVESGFATQKHIASLIPHMRSIPQPIIAAVNGAAAGGGFALVLGSDIRLASTAAKFNAAFIRIGLSACDIGTSWLLPRLIGAARAQELMLTGRIFLAEEAERIGLILETVQPEQLLERAFSKAREIMLNSPIGVALTKEGMWSALEIPGMQAAIDLENRQQIMATFSEDATETWKAFAEKRLPQYKPA